MQTSESLRETLLAFYEHWTASDAASFDDFVSADVTTVIGTADDEWFTGREQLRSGYGWDGLRLEGHAPEAWEHGDMGWAADRPTMHVDGVGPIRTRFTGVFRRERGRWRLVLSHFSVGVPDEEVAELQRRWLRSG